MKRLMSLVAAVAGAAGIATSFAGASTPSVDCSPGFVGKLNVPGNLIVPAGSTCGLTQGSTVGHDVIVESGAGFFPGGTTIGHDVKASHAAFVELGDPNNGTTETVVKHDVIIKFNRPSPGVGNGICQTRIGHNLTIENSKAGASEWFVGTPVLNGCRNLHPGVHVGHNATFTHNANSLQVGDLKVGRYLTYTRNHGPTNVLSFTTSQRGCKASHNSNFVGNNNHVSHGHNTCNNQSGHSHG